MRRAILFYFGVVVGLVGSSETTGRSNDTDNYHSPLPITKIPGTITHPVTSTRFPGCFHEGKWYPRNSEISRGYDGKSWCHGTYCDQSGQIVAWDNFHCSTTTATTYTTTTPVHTTLTEIPTTLPPTPVGCYQSGKWFSPGSVISRGSSYGWCYGTYCDDQGNIVSWDDWSCSTTAQPTTIPTLHPAYFTTEPPSGCNFRGWLYNLGSEISIAWSGGGRCHGKRCSDDAQIITWLAFDCKNGKDPFQNKRNCCWYRGHFYRRGMEIFRKQHSGKCFEGTCEKNAVITWKSLSCDKERQFLAGQRHMCSYRGQLYPRGSIINSRSLYNSRGFGWCVGLKCGRNRKVTTWGPAWHPGYC